MKSTFSQEHPFESRCAVVLEDIELKLVALGQLPWCDFWLNPRRLRGSDFLMRWSQGVWSEERLTQAVDSTGTHLALPYGPSGTAPDNDVRAFELYFERLEEAGLTSEKRPDLLIFQSSERPQIETTVEELGGLAELPFTPEDNPRMQWLLSKAILAVECENSLWLAKRMPDYGVPLSPQKRLDGKLGLKKTAIVATNIIKEEDREPLRKWQAKRGVPIHIWHAFYDAAFGISFDHAEQLISNGEIEGTVQVFQAPGGATTKKVIYKVYYLHAYPLATMVEAPKLEAESITDKNGHILPYVRFVGGRAALSEVALALLDSGGGKP